MLLLLLILLSTIVLLWPHKCCSRFACCAACRTLWCRLLDRGLGCSLHMTVRKQPTPAWSAAAQVTVDSGLQSHATVTRRLATQSWRADATLLHNSMLDILNVDAIGDQRTSDPAELLRRHAERVVSQQQTAEDSSAGSAASSLHKLQLRLSALAQMGVDDGASGASHAARCLQRDGCQLALDELCRQVDEVDHFRLRNLVCFATAGLKHEASGSEWREHMTSWSVHSEQIWQLWSTVLDAAVDTLQAQRVAQHPQYAVVVHLLSAAIRLLPSLRQTAFVSITHNRKWRTMCGTLGNRSIRVTWLVQLSKLRDMVNMKCKADCWLPRGLLELQLRQVSFKRCSSVPCDGAA